MTEASSPEIGASLQDEGFDFTVTDQGSVVLFTPLTERARSFSQTDLGLESWQWLGNSFAVDHRYAYGLVTALGDEGFEVKVEQ